MNTKRILFILISMIVVSCASRKNIVYLQDVNGGSIEGKMYETKFKPDDLLIIFVSSKDPEASTPFNLELVINPQSTSGMVGQRQQQYYLVDNNGEIDFPVLGKIKVAGLTRPEFVKFLKTKLSEFVEDPVINIRIMNYKVSVFGEVQRPGSFTIPSERITLLDAVSLAGDFTIYGSRKNVLLIRERNGKKISQRIDLTKSNFINSEYYYLEQNDVVYVEPNNTKVNSSVVGPNTSTILTALSLLITLLAITLR